MSDTHAAAQEAQARKKFSELCKQDTDTQRDFFLKRFILQLDDKYTEVMDIGALFKEKAKGAVDLDFVGAADLMQKMGKTRTATERKKELEDVDVDSNGRTSLIEYLLLHYKVMILESWFKRKGTEPTVDLSKDGVGLAGVGSMLILELYSPPLGLDPELEKMMHDMAVGHAEREKKIAELTAVIEAGGVKAMATKAELEKITKEDESANNHLEAKIKAAAKKAEAAAEKLLADKMEASGHADKAKSAAMKGGLAEKKAAFGN